jgi:hypothetical protein
MRHVRVRGTLVALPDPASTGDVRQLDMLDDGRRRVGSGTARARTTAPRRDDGPMVLRSYWRRQPCGPGGSLRKLVLVDVHAPSPIV